MSTTTKSTVTEVERAGSSYAEEPSKEPARPTRDQSPGGSQEESC